jgi:4-amino-4-deoxy-L-arabinose transferase-like glycosyltransferase
MPKSPNKNPLPESNAEKLIGLSLQSSNPERQSQLTTAALILCAIALLLWLRIPPFDYDEALYFAMALEMERGGHWLATLWDGQLMDDKPPVFMWLLRPFLSITSAASWSGLSRIPSLLCAFGTVLGLSFFNWGFQKPFKRTALLLCTALLPFTGGGLVLLDPALSLALLPPFLILFRSWNAADAGNAPRRLTVSETLALALSLTLGCALKGLVAWVIPGLAVALQCLWAAAQHSRSEPTNSASRLAQLIVRCGQIYGPAAALTVLGSAAFYGWMLLEGHSQFVTGFFLKHHLGRGSSAMEGHGGSFIYHWVVVGVGGGWLLARFLHLLSCNHKRAWLLLPQNSFALAWFLTPPLFFSFMATKLPNYTWPSWVALVALMMIADTDPKTQMRSAERLTPAADAQTPPHPRTRALLRAGYGAIQVVIAAIGVIYCAAGLAFVVLPILLPNLPFTIDTRAQALLQAAGSLTGFECAGFIISGCALFTIGVSIARITREPNTNPLNRVTGVALLHAALLISLLSAVSSYPLRAFHNPLGQASEWISARWPKADVITIGLRSPTFSSHYTGSGAMRQLGLHARIPDDRTQSAALALPVWSARGCEDFGRSEAAVFNFIKVCSPVDKE